MSSMVRLSYLLGWLFAAVAVIYKGLEIAGVHALDRMPISARGVLFFACFLFLATVASAAYEQAQGLGLKGRGTGA